MRYFEEIFLAFKKAVSLNLSNPITLSKGVSLKWSQNSLSPQRKVIFQGTLHVPKKFFFTQTEEIILVFSWLI